MGYVMKSTVKYYDGESQNNNNYNNNNDNNNHGIGEEGPVDFEMAITLAGQGKFNRLFLLALLPVCLANIYVSASVAYILPTAECDLRLTDFDKGMLNSMSFAGMILTSFVWGFIVDVCGRQKVMVWGFCVTALCTLASSFSLESWHLILFKLTDGILISGPYAALQSYVAEINSESMRAEVYMWMGVLFAVGHISLSGLAWLVLPYTYHWSFLFETGIEIKSWRIFLVLSALPGITSGIAMCFFPESPRFLLTKKRHSDALDVFKKIYSINTGKEPDTYPVKALEEEESMETKGVSFKEVFVGSLKQIQPIFMYPNVVVLIVTSFIQFGATIGSNTLRLWMPTIFSMVEKFESQHHSTGTTVLCSTISSPDYRNTSSLVSPDPSVKFDNCQNDVVNSSIYTDSMVVSIAAVIGYIIAKWLVNKLGKRVLMVVCFLGAGMSLGALYWSESNTSIMVISSIFVALASIGGTIVNNVVVDLFPTALRTMALSLTMAIGRVGAVVGNLLFPILFKLHCLGPFIMIGSVCLMCAVLTVVLPKKNRK